MFKIYADYNKTLSIDSKVILNKENILCSYMGNFIIKCKFIPNVFTKFQKSKYNSKVFKIYLLIMLLQLSHFHPHLTPLHPADPLPPTFPPYSSCPWVILISSLASTFPTLFLPSPCLFSTYHLRYLFSVPSPLPPTPLLITLHVISMSVVLFLF